MRTLLQDESKEVREHTVYAVLRADTKAGGRLLFEEAARADARLLPSELYAYNLVTQTGGKWKGTIVDWARTVLGDPRASSGVRTLALVLLGTTGSAEARPLVEARLQDPDLWQRRAAHRALWRLNRPMFQSGMAGLAADSSPRVREVLPAGLLKRDRPEFKVWFGERESAQEVVPYTRGSSHLALTEESEALLKKLSSDPDPAVRVSAMSALLSWRREVEPLALREALVAIGEEGHRAVVINLLGGQQWGQDRTAVRILA